MSKYIYLETNDGGFNDILCVINCIKIYCKNNGKILLLNTLNSCYKINFSDFCHIDCEYVITDLDKIRNILTSNDLSIYPNILNINDIKNILDNNFVYSLRNNEGFCFQYNDQYIPLKLPNFYTNENITIVITDLGSLLGNDNFKHFDVRNNYGFELFKTLKFKPYLIEHVKNCYSKIEKPYNTLQIRNTDINCNYEDLYNANKDYIHKYNNIYIATDDKSCLDFFRTKGLNVINFTTFPDTYENVSYGISQCNLHYSKINSKTKIMDLITDIVLLSMSEQIFSNSIGGFISLVRKCHQSSSEIKNQFQL